MFTYSGNTTGWKAGLLLFGGGGVGSLLNVGVGVSEIESCSLFH